MTHDGRSTTMSEPVRPHHLRTASAADTEVVGSWATTPAETERWCGAAHPVTAATMVGWWTDPELRPWALTTEQGLLIGYGELWLDPEEDEVELARLIVAPEHRGQGWGRLLVSLLSDEARRSGLAGVMLRVVPDNTAAIACYLACGFTRVDQADEEAWNAGQPRTYQWMTLG